MTEMCTRINGKEIMMKKQLFRNLSRFTLIELLVKTTCQIYLYAVY